MERKHILHRNRPRASNILSYRIVGFIKIHDFLHSWKVPSSPNDPSSSRWAQMGPSSSKWALDLQMKPIDFPKNDTRKKYFPGTWNTIPKSSCFDKMAAFFCFFGPMPLLFGPYRQLFFWAMTIFHWELQQNFLLQDQTGHLLVNLGLGIFRFPELFYSRRFVLLQNMFGKFGGEISRNK